MSTDTLADTPEAMRCEIDNEPRLGMHRPGLLPGMGRDADMDQRVFDALTMRQEGLTYAEIGRRLGRSREVVRHYCARGTESSGATQQDKKR